jgi:hypothetical protein
MSSRQRQYAQLQVFLRKQVTSLSFSSRFTTVCVRDCTRTEMREVLSVADHVKQSQWDYYSDHYQKDVVRLADERVQQVGILLLFPQW